MCTAKQPFMYCFQKNRTRPLIQKSVLKKLKSIKNQLNQSGNKLQQERNKKDSNQQLINQLESELYNHQASYNTHKTQLSKMQVTVVKESQDSVSLYQLQLKTLQQQLKLKETAYHDAFIVIKSEMKQIEGKSTAAISTQDKLVVEKLRGKLKKEKARNATAVKSFKGVQK